MALYTLGYVYQLGDFDTSGSNIAPPNESGAVASGSPPYQMTLNSGVSPLQIVIDDADSTFNETKSSDPSQPLAYPVTIDGVTYPAGSHVVINYVLEDANGFEGFSITIGATNSGSNTTTAFITTAPMVPGQTYTFTSNSNIGNGNTRPYSDFACFTTGTFIDTPDGTRRIEDLVPGDLVMTLEHGAQPVRWIGRRTVAGISAMAPVLIRAGTLGVEKELLVSPNHRLLIAGAETELLTGHDTLLVPAKHLVNGKTIIRQPCGLVTYVHLLFDHHQIVTTQGCISESYFFDCNADNLLDSDQAAELLELFPELAQSITTKPKLCHPEAKRFEASLVAAAIAA